MNNLDRPNLVDINILQKINDNYVANTLQGGTTVSSGFKSVILTNLLNFVQYAGGNTYRVIKENLFISIITISLILFLTWCYIEKKRYDAIQEIMLKKKYTKMLLEENLYTNNELEYFETKPDSVNLSELFTEINTELNTAIGSEKSAEPENQEQTVNPLINNQIATTQSKKELIENNVSTKEINVNKPIQAFAASISDNFMDVTTFNNSSYMLL